MLSTGYLLPLFYKNPFFVASFFRFIQSLYIQYNKSTNIAHSLQTRAIIMIYIRTFLNLSSWMEEINERNKYFFYSQTGYILIKAHLVVTHEATYWIGKIEVDLVTCCKLLSLPNKHSFLSTCFLCFFYSLHVHMLLKFTADILIENLQI